MQGTIRHIRLDRGFGFIRPDGDRTGRGDHFFHVGALQGLPFDASLEGQTVEFDSEANIKGLAATNVRPAN
jgi:cold shock CspA family protein